MVSNGYFESIQILCIFSSSTQKKDSKFIGHKYYSGVAKIFVELLCLYIFSSYMHIIPT